MDGQGHLLGKITAGLDVAVNKGGEPGGVPAHIPGRYGGKGRDRQRQRHHQEKEPFASFHRCHLFHFVEKNSRNFHEKS